MQLTHWAGGAPRAAGHRRRVSGLWFLGDLTILGVFSSRFLMLQLAERLLALCFASLELFYPLQGARASAVVLGRFGVDLGCCVCWDLAVSLHTTGFSPFKLPPLSECQFYIHNVLSSERAGKGAQGADPAQLGDNSDLHNSHGWKWVSLDHLWESCLFSSTGWCQWFIFALSPVKSLFLFWRGSGKSISLPFRCNCDNCVSFEPTLLKKQWFLLQLF